MRFSQKKKKSLKQTDTKRPQKFNLEDFWRLIIIYWFLLLLLELPNKRLLKEITLCQKNLQESQH